MSLGEKTQELQKYIKNNQNISDISQSEISKIYQDLIDCITDHNHLYYIESSPIISDFEYDQLFEYLKKIEQYFPYIISGDSPTQKLVNQIQDDFKKAEHKIPMLSLENSYDSQDLLEREQRINKILEKLEILEKPNYYIEPKFDGISIELIYQNGNFSQAITR
jgi:DNA ligase (NAD+)